MKPETGAQGFKIFLVATAVAVVGLFLTAQRCQSQIYTVGDYGGGDWTSGIGISGFSIFGQGNGDETVGQTFSINNVNALINSIQVPIYGSSSAGFQIGVAAWNGSQPTGSLLYLSDPISGVNGWQTFTVTPNNLTLNQNQKYVLIVTPNNFVNTSISYNTGMGYVSGYSGGEMFNIAGFQLSVNDLFTDSWSDANADFAFSINYEAAPVPEPTTPALLCLGSLAFWLCYRPSTKTRR